MSEQEYEGDDNTFLYEPVEYTLTLPGNLARHEFLQALNHWFAVPDAVYRSIAKIFDLICCSVILVDDVQDKAILRSGFPVAHNIYGTALTLNSSNMALFNALTEINSLAYPGAVEMFTEQLCRHYRGQGIEIWWRESCVCPTEDEYRNMICNKIGSLLEIPLKLMVFHTLREADMHELIKLISCFIQFRADYLNLSCCYHEGGKDFADDIIRGNWVNSLSHWGGEVVITYNLIRTATTGITEGKFTLPIIHAVNTREGDTRIINILKQHTSDVELKSYCVQLLEDFGSLEYAKTQCMEAGKEILQLIESMGRNGPLLAVINRLMGSVRENRNGSDFETV